MSTLKIDILKSKDIPDIIKLDEESGFFVQQWITEENDNIDYAWGAFLTDENNNTILIGYCTTGYADDCDELKSHAAYDTDSILLSDVYIKPEYRHKGYGSQMIQQAIYLRRLSDADMREPIYIQIMYNELAAFYKRLGFEHINGKNYANNLVNLHPSVKRLPSAYDWSTCEEFYNIACLTSKSIKALESIGVHVEPDSSDSSENNIANHLYAMLTNSFNFIWNRISQYIYKIDIKNKLDDCIYENADFSEFKNYYLSYIAAERNEL